MWCMFNRFFCWGLYCLGFFDNNLYTDMYIGAIFLYIIQSWSTKFRCWFNLSHCKRRDRTMWNGWDNDNVISCNMNTIVFPVILNRYRVLTYIHTGLKHSVHLFKWWNMTSNIVIPSLYITCLDLYYMSRFIVWTITLLGMIDVLSGE